MEHKIFPVVFVFLTITAISSAQYDYPDLAGDADIINFADFAVFAENWQKSGTGLAGDFDDSGKVDFNDLAYLSYYWLTAQWECRKIDLDYSGLIDFSDFVIFADCWLSSDGSPNYKTNCDFDDDDIVDIYDLKAFCNCWLKGTRPQGIWEQFKAALAAGDIDRAVSFFAVFVADDYRDIFNEHSDKLQSLAADMGQLTLEYRDRDIAVYELSNAAGNLFFPVVFTMDDESKWKIAVF
ncbi:MAG: hypothetical protein CVV39_00905 [Planctomycetes bacterium HGW-Planctomycetes-1]|nr:MAG: hypothetical protein CVV39_00905 [Planctomycetes bacterium HGW-Planctomycetes-1]